VKRAISLAVATLVLSPLALMAATTQVTGWISDSMCGAKHAGSGADCVKKCIEGGLKPVFVDEEKQVWSIDNPDSVKDFYGGHVTATVVADATNKSVHIESIAAAK